MDQPQALDNAANPDAGSREKLNILTIGPFIIAFLILVGYAFFVASLVNKVTVTDAVWVKLIDLFGSVEAIVFTAVGFLFGREVNRTRALHAEQKEKEAQAAAKKANKEKNALANGIDDLPLPTAPDTPTMPMAPSDPHPFFKELQPNKNIVAEILSKSPKNIALNQKLMALKALAKKYTENE